MRLVVTAWLLTMAVQASAGCLVTLDAGDSLPADACWADGDRFHLLRGGVDMSVPRDRVSAVRETPDPVPVSSIPHAAPSDPRPRSDGAAVSPGKVETDRALPEIEAERRAIEKHLLRVQQESFEAEARGEPEKKQRRLSRELRRTQERRSEVLRDLERAAPTP